MCKKKSKIEVVRPDFTFKIYRNRLPRARFRFLEKKKKKPARWRTTSPLMSSCHDDLTLFCKKKIKRPFFTNSWSK